MKIWGKFNKKLGNLEEKSQMQGIQQLWDKESHSKRYDTLSQTQLGHGFRETRNEINRRNRQVFQLKRNHDITNICMHIQAAMHGLMCNIESFTRNRSIDLDKPSDLRWII